MRPVGVLILKQVATIHRPLALCVSGEKTKSFPSPEGSAYSSPESWWFLDRYGHSVLVKQALNYLQSCRREVFSELK